MNQNRAVVIERLAREISELEPSRPQRVAIDGRTASGKTTLANELAKAIERLGRPVIRTSIDGFHRSKSERYARGRYSAEGYYRDARDLDAIVSLLLKPLALEGDRRYCTASFDLGDDVPLPLSFSTAEPNAVLVVDGTFLQRPELRTWWDFTVFVDTEEAVAEHRGIARDGAHLGDEALATRLFAERYRPAFNLYAGEVDPKSADAVFGNDDFNNPTLQLRRLAGGEKDATAST
jgi:uridine kinase